MNEIKMEYLITFLNNKVYCDSVERFDKLLMLNRDIKLNKSNIEFKGIEIEYHNKKYSSVDSNNVYNLTFEITDFENIDKFEVFLKIFRQIIYKMADEILVIQDDLSMYYSIQAYPLFHYIENSMRKLITKFMVIKVGQNWDKETTNEYMKKAFKNEKKKDSYGYLHNTNFLDLSKYIFDKYPEKRIEMLTSEELEENASVLKKYIPKSNWERFFKEIVEYEDQELQKLWNELYELRCKVAHNNKFAKEDYNKVITKTNDVKIRLEEAIKNVDKLVIGVEERRIITESVISNHNNVLKTYLMRFNELEKRMRKFLGEPAEDRNLSMHRMIRTYDIRRIFNNVELEELLSIIKVRNMIVHDTIEIEEIDGLEKIMENMREYIVKLEVISIKSFDVETKEIIEKTLGKSKLN